jgi:hypothetical protein
LGSNHQDLTNETLLESEYLKMFGNTKFDQTSVTSETLFTNKSERPSDVIEVKYEKVFVIVAYRDREENKEVFVKEMNSYLSRKECLLKNFSLWLTLISYFNGIAMGNSRRGLGSIWLLAKNELVIFKNLSMTTSSTGFSTGPTSLLLL